jgi:hypothetical protein
MFAVAFLYSYLALSNEPHEKGMPVIEPLSDRNTKGQAFDYDAAIIQVTAARGVVVTSTGERCGSQVARSVLATEEGRDQIG